MMRIASTAALVLTLVGGILFFQEAAAFPAWDAAWVMALLAAGYAEFFLVFGLSRARLAAGMALAVFISLEILNIACGWPLGPVHFTGPSFLRIGGGFSMLAPLFASAVLLLSARAVATGFPSWEGRTFAAGVAGAFTLTIGNAFVLLEKFRLWWLWNPWHQAGSAWIWISLFGTLLLAAFFLARAMPDDTALKLKRWSEPATILVAMNALFLSARVVSAVIHNP
jgi:hypothetical protein